MTTATQDPAPTPLADVFHLDPQTDDLSTVTTTGADTTNNGCGPSPTTGPPTGCASPDGPALPVRECNIA